MFVIVFILFFLRKKNNLKSQSDGIKICLVLFIAYFLPFVGFWFVAYLLHLLYLFKLFSFFAKFINKISIKK